MVHAAIDDHHRLPQARDSGSTSEVPLNNRYTVCEERLKLEVFDDAFDQRRSSENSQGVRRGVDRKEGTRSIAVQNAMDGASQKCQCGVLVIYDLEALQGDRDGVFPKYRFETYIRRGKLDDDPDGSTRVRLCQEAIERCLRRFGVGTAYQDREDEDRSDSSAGKSGQRSRFGRNSTSTSGTTDSTFGDP